MKKIIVATFTLVMLLSCLCGCVTMLRVTQKNGFIREDGDVYYYKNGEMQVGWQIIDNERYYFDAYGRMHRGWLVWEKDAFYFRQGDGGDDIGGTLLINTQAVLQDLDGIYWYVEFGVNGKVTLATLDVEWYNDQGLELPNVTEPNFGK